MVRHAGKICVRKSDPSEGSGAKDFAGSRLAVLAEEESGRWAQVSVPPAIEDDACDVAAGIESAAREHFGELLANLALVFAEWHGHQFAAAEVTLLLSGLARVSVKNFDGEHRGRIGPDRGRLRSAQSHL